MFTKEIDEGGLNVAVEKAEDADTLFNSIVLFYLKENVSHEKTSLKSFITSIERKIIYTTLEVTQGNQKNAAKILGLGATTLNEKLKKFSSVNNQFKKDILTNIENKIQLLNRQKSTLRV